MASLQAIDGLSECIVRAVQEHIEKTNIEWPFVNNLTRPILRVEAFLEDGDHDLAPRRRSERIASQTLELTELMTPSSSQSPATIVPDSNSEVQTSEQEHTSSVEIVNEHASTALDAESDEARRSGVGGLRIAHFNSIQEDPSEHQRQMQTEDRIFPKRRKVVPQKFDFQPSTLDKLVIGIWEQIHGSISLDPQAIFEQFQVHPVSNSQVVQSNVSSAIVSLNGDLRTLEDNTFSKMNAFCRKVTQASRVCRSIELIVQARWVELFEEQIQIRISSNPDLSASKHRRATFMEACQDFGWSEKELRNKMAIWRGYKEVKDAAGWAALVFAGMGIYRFCKYRVGFDKDAMRRLRSLRPRLEVAADTLHPHWRQLLSIVGEQSVIRYKGHPHDWVIFEDGSDPVSLCSTYTQYDPYFTFEHLEESVIDERAWGCDDPRWVPHSNALARTSNTFICAACGEKQSDDPKLNSCYCFPRLFGCVKRSPPPVQVFRTSDGRNNGLLALTSYERGGAVGEFVGLITKGVRHLDVMDSSTAQASYQIWQGRQGNYTRFINHSCKANAQFQQFNWLDTQRVILVSKGIEAGAEITVDYSDRYWGGLDKKCLCGESCCRYRRDK
ncbi:SET domain-containing protein [Lojkania enalia]|uniref:SET domain-containing protein n=1 Tax=Lojkania enalia TaxID=147567 RepID=A0A9P4N803_9PLEO|nr:SET domain-containing protein [Didymosphaeria enalia]